MAEAVPGASKRLRGLALLVLVAATALYALSLPFAVFFAVMASLGTDSGEAPATWATLFGALGYLLLVVVALVAAWVLFRKGRYRAAMGVLLLPLLGAPLMAAAAALTLGR